ncbi:MAG: UvrABC system protein B [Tenericutes bacterium ADurb.Bin239]|nr:MAG: UvrABC system protein B [Tenericutes bacterium ADurb.Bin239]
MKKIKHKFVLETTFTPTGDQPTAIKELVDGIKRGEKHQVLLGATGTGKTFTIANVIEGIQKPTLVLVHNKTLAGQLYAEFKALFPNNRVEYFVSNFDFYQPEAYVPSRDMYIEKEAVQNAEIEMLRSAAINSLLERNDTIIVASVAAIYGLSDPEEYSKLAFNIVEGEVINRRNFLIKLVDAQYTRNDYELRAGTFRVRGDVIEIMLPISEDYLIQVDTFDDVIEKIREIDVLTGEVRKTFNTYPIFPAYAYASSRERINTIIPKILSDLASRLSYFVDQGKLLEAERLEFRTRQDVDSLQEFGICPGIENYARYIDGRKEGEKPFTLMDYFPKNYLLVIDESHVTLPQVRGMFNGDRSRKQNLVDYGFRLPSALDNRPLQFNEFENMINQVIYTSATPGDYELDKTGGVVVEQLIRPTGLIDPAVMIKPSVGQIDDLMSELNEVIERGERAMVVTLTIKMAEDLTHYLKEHGFKVVYLHNETKTLERSQIIYELRKGKHDVLVGINLLREGLDIPEVSLVAIIDADKEGFLRSERSLIQVMGRASRNVNGKVVMYAASVTGSMERAIAETKRRRNLQIAYNKKHGIIPKTIIKPLGEPLHNFGTERELERINKGLMTRKQLEKYIREIRGKMNAAAKAFEFEKAIEYREILFELEGNIRK